MASKSVSSTLAGKVVRRSAIVDKQEEAVPLVQAALEGEAPAEVGQAVISTAFDPDDHSV